MSFNQNNLFLNLKIFSVEDLIIFFLIYSFFKLLFLSVIQELLWPTQFFNRRNNNSTDLIKYRVFTEFLIKSLISISVYKQFYLKFYKNFINRFHI
jgi:hypothetical protein